MSRLDHTLAQSEDFLAEAAHRIRTPLAIVRSHAEGTLQRVKHDENRAALQSMVRAIDESSRAAGQLLDHAMVTFRSENLKAEDVDLVEILHDLVERMTPLADLKDISLSLKTDAPVILSGDIILLQNAFRNLIDNALKYSPIETGVEIVVTNKPNVCVSVLDSGQGFDVDEIPTLSGRFIRGKDAHVKVGSGLGLTIAKEVVEVHGGQISLRNRPEGGACVSLHF